MTAQQSDLFTELRRAGGPLRNATVPLDRAYDLLADYHPDAEAWVQRGELSDLRAEVAALTASLASAADDAARAAHAVRVATDAAHAAQERARRERRELESQIVRLRTDASASAT